MSVKILFKGVGKMSATLRRVTRQIQASMRASGQAVKTAARQFDHMRTASRKVQARIRAFGQAAKTAARQFDHMRAASRKIGDMGKYVSNNITAPIVQMGMSTIRSAAQFEQSMNRVGALTGATGKDFSRLRAQARKMGRTTQYTASQAAEAMGYLAKSGLDTEKIIAALPKTLQLAASGQMSLSRAAETVTTSLKKSGGIIEQTGGARMNGAIGAMTRLTSAFEDLQLTLADAGALKWFTAMVQELTGWVKALGKASPATLRFVSIIALIFAAAGPLLTTIGQLGMGLHGLSIAFSVFKDIKIGARLIGLIGPIWGVVTATWAWTAAMLASPMTWIVLGVIALIAALVLLWKNWAAVTAFLKKIWGEIKAVFLSRMKALIKYLLGIDMFAAAIKWMGGFADGVVARWRALTAWLSGAIAKLTGMMPDWVKNRLGISAAITTTDTHKSSAAASNFKSAYRGRHHGPAHATVGGELRIKIDSDGRPHVKTLKSDNPNVGINVDTGLVMGAAG